jgi:hypothetical protein
MGERVMSDIEKRIESLEKTNRLWRYTAGLFACLLIVTLTVGVKLPGSVPEVLQAGRIEVLRPDGEPGIALVAEADRSAIWVGAQGPDHKRGISMVAHKDAVEVVLLKHAEAPLFIARVNDDGTVLLLSDGRQPSQKPRSIILRSTSSAEEDNQGLTKIYMTKGPRNIQAGLSLSEDGKGTALFLGGDKGKSVNILVNQQSGKVDFLDENNKAIWTMP